MQASELIAELAKAIVGRDPHVLIAHGGFGHHVSDVIVADANDATDMPELAPGDVLLDWYTDAPSKREKGTWKALAAAEKVAIIEAMGFTPMGATHDEDCPSLVSGYRCNCVPPATVWAQPADVDTYRGETWDERRDAARARKGKD